MQAAENTKHKHKNPLLLNENNVKGNKQSLIRQVRIEQNVI